MFNYFENIKKKSSPEEENEIKRELAVLNRRVRTSNMGNVMHNPLLVGSYPDLPGSAVGSGEKVRLKALKQYQEQYEYLDKVFREGQDSRDAGDLEGTNPYQVSTEEYDVWSEGWNYK